MKNRALLAGTALAFLLLSLGGTALRAQPKDAAPPAAQASLQPSDLAEFAAQPPAIRQLITDALALTRRGLTYQYGSADPKNGGMDCSGTVNYLLQQEKVPGVPREASAFYVWTRKRGLFQAVVSTDPKTFELDALHPGDLLFWTGTYAIDRDPPVTHVMIYLGTEKKSGKRVMFGASEGRRYAGAARRGVSVFDFVLPGLPAKGSPATGTSPRFIGYAPIPDLPEPAPPAPVPAPAPAPSPAEKPPAVPAPAPEPAVEAAPAPLSPT